MDINDILQDEHENHSFNVGDAKKYGVECAVILFHIKHWIKRNILNEKHFYNGNYWTYNSVKAFTGLFPYFTDNQIRRYLDKLVEMGVLEKGNFNQNPYDRTSWYAISDWRKYFLDLAEPKNSFGKSAKTYNEADTKADNITDNKSVLSFSEKGETTPTPQTTPQPKNTQTVPTQTVKEAPKQPLNSDFNQNAVKSGQAPTKSTVKDYYRDFSDLVPSKDPEKEAQEFRKMCQAVLKPQPQTEPEDYPDYEPTLFV